MQRYAITIVGYIVAEDEEAAKDVLDDISGAGMAIESATVAGDDWWADPAASTYGYVDDAR